MTRDSKAAAATDAELVAYLDGELTPADSVRIAQQIAADEGLAARLDHLMRGGRPFREAFDGLLADAPTDRLEAMLEASLAQPAPAPGFGPVLRRFWPAAAAAALLLLTLGAGLDRLVVPPAGGLAALEAQEADDWRSAVADYLSLYTRETLANAETITDSPRLAGLADRLGLPLTPARVALPGLALKRVDLYAYDGKPLALLAYVAGQSGPVALCITKGDGSATPRQLEQRRGMTVVYWSQGHNSFMLIGDAAPSQLQALAATLADRFAGKPEDRG